VLGARDMPQASPGDGCRYRRAFRDRDRSTRP
jgi:hypothetical protein